MAVSQEEILETISSMTIMEVVDLISAMEEKFGVTASAAVAAAPAAGGGEAAAAEEKDEFDVVMSSFGDNKVSVIKAVRSYHQPWPQGSQGNGGRHSVDHQGRCNERRSRGHQEAAGRSRRQRRAQVSGIRVIIA